MNDDGKITRRPDSGSANARRRDTGSDGRSPAIFYHGTIDVIEAFQAGYRNHNDSGWLGHGIDVATVPALANSYANIKGGDAKPNVMALHIKPHTLFLMLSSRHGNILAQVCVIAHQENAYGPNGTPKATGKAIKGSYHAATGRLVLAAANLRDAGNAKDTLAHEAL
nr:hypothetical protein [uncultured Halomonas sp.]